MKKIIVVVIFIAGLIGVFGSCDLLNNVSATAPERVNLFISGVLSDSWGTLQSHFYGTGEPGDYEAMNSGETYWETTLFYDAESITVSGSPAADAKTIGAVMKIAKVEYSLTFHLKMKPGSNNYLITLIDFTNFPNSDDVRHIEQ